MARTVSAYSEAEWDMAVPGPPGQLWVVGGGVVDLSFHL